MWPWRGRRARRGQRGKGRKMYRHPLVVARAVGAGRTQRPRNHRLAIGLRLAGEAPAAEVVQGELARDRPLAAVEAALFLADEPVNAKKLATLAGLADATEARRQVERLRELYE